MTNNDYETTKVKAESQRGRWFTDNFESETRRPGECVMSDYPHIACYKPDDWTNDQWREQIRTTTRRITCGQNDQGKYCYVYEDYWEALREWERQNKLKIAEMRPIIADLVAKQQDSLNMLGKDYDISADWLIYEFGKQFRAIERKKERGQ